MGLGGGLPSPDPPVRAEIVHHSEHTRVTRLFVPEGTVIRKEPLGPDAELRLRHEVAMLGQLGGVAGIARLADAPRYPGSIVLEDAGWTSLAGLAKPLTAEDLAGLAVELARTVAEMHRCGIMHRDITPANVVISGDGAPCLVDFGLATLLAEIRPEFTHHTEIAGTLAYLAPEATGRTGRAADARADLYALGAVLYELATGRPPFDSGDPLRLTHDHLARVPVPPSDVNPAVPAAISEIIMHLLEKEPDYRYQTADGVVFDLERLRHAHARPGAPFRVGEGDVPLRLLPPSRLVGRDQQIAALETAFEQAVAGRCRGLLVCGAPGVGKTVLADELRPAVTGRGGWFVAGKFDLYRRDLEFDAANQAFRALGRLLLAEPDDELALVREQILAAVGPNAGLLAAVLPEFAALLAVPADPGDPLTAQVRAQRASVQVLQAVASPKRPLVVFLDDLQWAGLAPLGVVDLLLGEEPVDHVLLLAAYREGDVDAEHPLSAWLSRWRERAGVRYLHLANLPVSGSAAMVAEMLHVEPPAAASLAGVIEPHTHGNPYETVELLNALRRDGVLAATAAGWRWDETAVRAHLGQSEMAGLLAARVKAMPPPSRQMVEAMACLGGRAELSVLQAAIGEPAGAVEQRLAPALAEGVLVAEPGAGEAVRFRHDRIREAILTGLDSRRRALQLAMARRLAGVPELFAVAAEQYVPVADELEGPAERRQVAGLLRRAAAQAALIGDYALVDTLLAAALPLIGPDETATLIEAHTARHAALFGLGRLEDADEEYRAIEGLCPAVLDRADAIVVQVRSLTNRNRFEEAVGLGLAALRELGITVPAAALLAAELDRQFGYLYRWLETDTAGDLAQPEVTDPALLAACRLIDAVARVAYHAADHAAAAWLSLEALRVWIQHGPGPTLLGAANHAAIAAVAVRGDYAAGYRAVRRVLAVCEGRGYEPGVSNACSLFSAMACWFEPIENAVQAAQRAREGLIAVGDMATAGYAYYATVYCLLDCAPTLDGLIAEVEAGLAFTRRTGNEQLSQWLGSYRRLAGVLRGEGSATAGVAAPADGHASNPVAVLAVHITGAIAAAIFGEQAALARHTAEAMPLLPAVEGLYPSAVARLLRGLALAGQARTSDGEERAGLLAELEELVGWLAARAADAPDNFVHLLRWLEAERAWTAGDFRAAALAFDAARREAAARCRPWHRALITERAARFYLGHGLDQAGYDLLAQAREQYLASGATAKAAQLDWAYPVLRPQLDAAAGDGDGPPADHPSRGAGVTAGTIDLLGIVSASQALSSQTSIGRLHAKVAEVLGAMTGAAGVLLALRDAERRDWLLPAPGGDDAVPAASAGREGAVPMTVLRYVLRTGEPLVVADAAADDRFARDPYFAEVGCCALLAVPVVSRGALRAVLVLENRLLRGAFTTERLDAVKLIAGQLAVSLDNAQLYTGFRRMADEQAALRRVAMLVAQGAAPTSVFDAVAAEIKRLLDADGVTLGRYEPCEEVTVVAHRGAGAKITPPGTRVSHEGQNVTTLVRRSRAPARVEHYEDTHGTVGHFIRSSGVRVSVGSPIVTDGRAWGVAIAYWTHEQSPPAGTEERMAQFAQLLETAIANADSRAELMTSRARIVAAADDVRRRIERDLHDGAQQRLVSLALFLRAARAAVTPELGELGAQLDRAAAEADGALDELREIARGIHPAVLARGGLRPALRTLARRFPGLVDLDLRADGRLPEHIEVSAYYVIAEALTNAARHAHASAVTVTVEADAAGGLLRVAVRDDGAGGADIRRGTGLTGLKDRVEALGGRIFLDSPPGAGTSLRAELPLAAAGGSVTSR
jgi:predicted ATPase/signal transduction histidine kinase